MMVRCASCGAAWTSGGMSLCPMCGARVAVRREPEPAPTPVPPWVVGPDDEESWYSAEPLRLVAPAGPREARATRPISRPPPSRPLRLSLLLGAAAALVLAQAVVALLIGAALRLAGVFRVPA